MFHGHLDCFQNPPLGGRSNTKPVDYGTPNTHNRRFILSYHVWGPAWIEIPWNSIWLRARSHMSWGSHCTWESMTKLHAFGHIWLHTTLEGPWPHYMILEVPWDGLWTLSVGLSQFHGHGSWLVCEVGLSPSATGSTWWWCRGSHQLREQGGCLQLHLCGTPGTMLAWIPIIVKVGGPRVILTLWTAFDIGIF